MFNEAGRNLRFASRRDAGRVLAERLRAYAGRDDVLVLGLPRGGVPVAYEAARSLGAAPNVFVIVLEGTLMLVIGGTPVRAAPGTIVRMPAHLPHAVDAIEPARMLLIMLRDV